MPRAIMKLSLPGFDAETDTNLDHFSLYVDENDAADNILIKEFARGSAVITRNNTTPYEITHSLGYIPMFLVFVYDKDSHGYYGSSFPNKWKLIPHIQNAVVAPPYYVYADTTKIYIWNFDGDDGVDSTTFKWYIFYDNQVGSGAQSITESDAVIKVSKTGIDAEETTDPNDFIFHSDLNTFKILKEGNANITYTADGDYSFAHGATLSNPTSFMVFVKFPDGFTVLCAGRGRTVSQDSSFLLRDMYMDTSNIGFSMVRFGGTDTALKFKYYIFETPLTV